MLYHGGCAIAISKLSGMPLIENASRRLPEGDVGKAVGSHEINLRGKDIAFFKMCNYCRKKNIFFILPHHLSIQVRSAAL